MSWWMGLIASLGPAPKDWAADKLDGIKLVLPNMKLSNSYGRDVSCICCCDLLCASTCMLNLSVP